MDLEIERQRTGFWTTSTVTKSRSRTAVTMIGELASADKAILCEYDPSGTSRIRFLLTAGRSWYSYE